jgi:hypothetical protein
MHPEIALALAEERQRELARLASQRHVAHADVEYAGDVTPRHVPAWHIPRYRVSWSRTTLPAIGVAGRRSRSWVIVISATRGL